MSRKSWIVAAALVVGALAGFGCTSEPQEKVVFQNRAGVNAVSCYVDDVLKGTVDNGRDLEIEGDFEGDHVVRAQAVSLSWGPVTHHFANGETFLWEFVR
jgi:hypothetical protein